jgi:hypothetical protein
MQPHIARGTLQVYFCMLRVRLVSSVAGTASISICPYGGLDARLQRTWCCFAGHQDCQATYDFFLWGYVKDCVLKPPVSQDLSDL